MKQRYPDLGWDIWNNLNFDNDTLSDGYEDLNKNGTMDPDECDPFVEELPLKLSMMVAGADVNNPDVTINDVSVADIYTGNEAGYRSYDLRFNWCGKLIPLETNKITFTAYYGEITGVDDFQIRDIKITDPGDINTVLLSKPGPYHLGENTLEQIQQKFEDGKWYDPNPPGFWVELHGRSVTFEFYWKGYGAQE